MNQQVSNTFAKIRAKLQPVLADLPITLGNATVNYSLDAFASESWEGVPWERRKSKKDITRALLVKTGRGKRATRIIRSTPNMVRVGNDVPYMAAHNNGATISRAPRSETFVRNRFEKGKRAGKFKKGTSAGQGLSFKAYNFQIPQRRFLAHSKGLVLELRRVTKVELQKALAT